MRAVIRRGNKLVLEEMATPTPGPGQVLVRTLACGICGSDLHALEQPLGEGVAGEVVYGHEFCCEILENGPGAARFKPGQRVCSMPILPSATGLDTVGYSPTAVGGFAENMLLADMLLLPVPNGLASETAALTEPLAVGEHAVARADPHPGQAYLVIGCGPVGLAVIDSLKARGLGPIYAADYSPQRRALAEKIGADKVIDPAKESPHASWAEMGVQPPALSGIFQLGGGASKQPVIFECVGAPGVLQAIAAEAPRHSRIVVAGVCMQMDQIHPLTLISKEIEMRFVLAYTPDEFAASLHRLAEGETNFPAIVTQRVGLGETPDAFVRLQTDKSQVKILVTPGGA